MRKLILHIGTHKTGTTSLQSFFADNSDIMAQQGIFVPRFEARTPSSKYGDYKLANYGRNGYYLRAKAQLDTGERKYARESASHVQEQFALLADIMAGHDVVLLSDERFYYEGTLTASFWPILKKTTDSLGFDEVKLVVYLRRQDEFGLSLWREFSKGIKQKKSLSDLLEQKALFYREWLAEIEEVYGREALCVRPYDRALFSGGDIFHDFCNAAGIAWDDRFILPETEFNPSMTDTAAEIKRLANGAKAYKKSNNFLYGPAIRYSKRMKGADSATLLTKNVYRDLRKAHAADNKYIADRYMGGKGGSLTRWPAYNPSEWSACSEETINAIVQIFSEAMADQQKKLIEQSRAIARLEREIERLAANNDNEEAL